MRVVEQEERRIGLVNPVSNFNLVGAAQVGKSSMTGMRLFVRLDPHLPIWPFDPLPETGSAVVEIYTSIAAVAAGLPRGRTKVRDPETLDTALARLGSRSTSRLPATTIMPPTRSSAPPGFGTPPIVGITGTRSQ
jgi:hypothetical protein